MYPDWSPVSTWSVALVATLLLFVSVLAHEFGHSLVARSQGIPVRGITLFILGGVAQLGREPDTPGREAWMAIAGPLVSAAIGGLTLAGAYLISGPDQLVAVLAYLGVANLALLVFNLLPGFPMDGGRVLRALLWRITHDVVRATRWAAAVGQVFAVVFIAGGVAEILFTGGFEGIWLILVGWLLIGAARATSKQTQIDHELSGVPAGRLMTRFDGWLSPYMTLDWAAHDRFIDWETRCLPVAAEDPEAEYGGLMCCARPRAGAARAVRPRPRARRDDAGRRAAGGHAGDAGRRRAPAAPRERGGPRGRGGRRRPSARVHRRRRDPALHQRRAPARRDRTAPQL